MQRHLLRKPTIDQHQLLGRSREPRFTPPTQSSQSLHHVGIIKVILKRVEVIRMGGSVASPEADRGIDQEKQLLC